MARSIHASLSVAFRRLALLALAPAAGGAFAASPLRVISDGLGSLGAVNLLRWFMGLFGG